MVFETADVLSAIAVLFAYSEYRRDKDPRENKKISNLLEKIYFSSGGVIDLVRSYANGVEPSDELKARVLTEFHDWDSYAADWRRLLDTDKSFVRSISISKRKHLQSVGWNKVQVRDAVKTLMGDGFQEVSQEDAMRILEDILRLNKAIERAQNVLAS